MGKVASENTGSALSAVDDWTKAGRRLAADLEREVDELKTKLAKAQAALRKLAALDDIINNETPTECATTTEDETTRPLAVQIREAIASHPKGATIANIRDWLTENGVSFEPAHLPTYVYRMQKSKVLRARGPRGGRKYAIALIERSKKETPEPTKALGSPN